MCKNGPKDGTVMRYEFTLAFRHLDFDDETLEQLANVLPVA